MIVSDVMDLGADSRYPNPRPLPNPHAYRGQSGPSISSIPRALSIDTATPEREREPPAPPLPQRPELYAPTNQPMHVISSPTTPTAHFPTGSVASLHQQLPSPTARHSISEPLQWAPPSRQSSALYPAGPKGLPQAASSPTLASQYANGYANGFVPSAPGLGHLPHARSTSTLAGQFSPPRPLPASPPNGMVSPGGMTSPGLQHATSSSTLASQHAFFGASTPTVASSATMTTEPQASAPTSAYTAPADPSPSPRRSREPSTVCTTPNMWVHDGVRAPFLPPAPSPGAPALELLKDSLEVVHEYREFVETVGRLEAEYGRSLSAAVKKLEQRLDSINLAAPGARKPPQNSLVSAVHGHMEHVATTAKLHQKRPAALHSQLGAPLTALERRGTEATSKLRAWGKDVKVRWDDGRERVDAARLKYHAAVRDHEAALTKLRAAPAPASVGYADAEWMKFEKTANEAEANRADRKRAYLVALAGEGPLGGGGWDLAEGGGEAGWGEEARQLYTHVQNSALELFRHHAHDEGEHLELLVKVMGRGKACYQTVNVDADANAFLQWNNLLSNGRHGSFSEGLDVHRAGRNSFASARSGTSGPSDVSPANSSNPTSNANSSSGHVNSRAGSNSRQSGQVTSDPPLSPVMAPGPEAAKHLANGVHSIALSRAISNGEVSPEQLHPSLLCYTFQVPPSYKNEVPELGTEKRQDRNWLVNRWLISAAALAEVAGPDGEGGRVGNKRKQLATLKQQCISFAENRGLGDPEETWERRLQLHRESGADERRVAVAMAEMACIEDVIGLFPRPELPHKFKDKQYATPSQCDACGQSVWNPLKSELCCKMCNIALHSKCALHVDPECTGLKSTTRRRSYQPAAVLGRGTKIKRSITMRLRRHSTYDENAGPQEISRQHAPSLRSRLEPLRDDELHVSPFVFTSPQDAEADSSAAILATLSENPAAAAENGLDSETLVMDPIETPLPPLPAGLELARVLYSFPAQGPLELSVDFGDVVRVLEPDVDGSGWVKVRKTLEVDSGPVPSEDAVDAAGSVPATALLLVDRDSVPRDGGGGMFVTALFDFPPATHTLGANEMPVRQGCIYELSDEGYDYDEAWAEVVVPDGSGVRLRGVVPKVYLKEI